MRGGHGMESILGLEVCSGGYWAMFGIQYIFPIVMSICVYYYLTK